MKTTLADSVNVDSIFGEPVQVIHKPKAQRAVWMATLCPGLGQIYNRSYWKLPIVYGGLMGCGYAIAINQTNYTDYKNAYRDLFLDNKNHCVEADNPEKSYVKILPNGYTIDQFGGVGQYMESLQTGQIGYRRYRDISVVVTVLVYALSIIDAYVDAQLFDFDISPDLSMHAEPALYTDPYNNKSAEVRLALTIK